MTTIADFHAETLTGQDQDLAAYAGDVVLVVNTASACGFTPQLEGLEKLFRDHQGEGLTVLGFPCNQFREQEPGSAQEIGEFCQRNYGVTFPMFAKIEVNGQDEHPLYGWLKGSKKGLLGGKIKWNFTKFLLGRDGTVIGRYAPTTKPEDIESDIVKALQAEVA